MTHYLTQDQNIKKGPIMAIQSMDIIYNNNYIDLIGRISLTDSIEAQLLENREFRLSPVIFDSPVRKLRAISLVVVSNDPPPNPANKNPFPSVRGKCPSCGRSTLFLATGGFLTCGNLRCMRPSLISDILEEGVPRPESSESGR